MSQIPRSQQLALKKKSDSSKKQTNGSSNGLKYPDKDVIIIDDDYTAIPVAREEIIGDLPPPTQPPAEEIMKKKRGRKSKFSTESRESDTSETSKRSDSQNEISEEILKTISAQDFTPEASPKQQEQQEVKTKQKTRLELLQNASTIVNLSTVSQSTLQSDDVSLETPTKVVPERRVSGRRSTRPIDDIKFSYRTPDNLTDSMDATTNATLGSELGASMIETPAKRRAIDLDLDEVEESPKRSKLDISALFSNFTSPVSLLRNKFMRTNIASTPKVGDELNASEISLNGSSELKEIDLNAEEAKEDDLKIIVKPIKKTTCSIM